VPKLRPGPETVSTLADSHVDLSEISGKPASTTKLQFTVVGYGFSARFSVPIVLLWTEKTPAFFERLTLPVVITKANIMLISGFPLAAIAMPSPPPALSLGPAPAPPSIPKPIVLWKPFEKTGVHPSRDKAIDLLYRNMAAS
jgi:hypothetical protein